MKIDHEFTVGVPADRAWEVLTDLPGIAPCMPGARLTGVDGDVYTCTVKVKVGPVVSEYSGTVRFLEKDDAGHHAVIDAKGRDSRGAGNASARITARLRPDGERTVVTVDTDLKISGRVAQFGSGMIKEVSAKLLGQFVDCLESRLTASPASPGSPASPATPAAPATPLPDQEKQASQAHQAGQPDQAGQPERAGQPDRSEHADQAERADRSGQAGRADQPGQAEQAGPGPGEPLVTAGAPAAEPASDPNRPGVRDIDSGEAQPLDVVSIAGGSVFRRVLPVAAVLLVVLVAVVVWILVS